MKRVVILGAGPCGLTAGWYLAKNGIAVDLIEKRPYVGGLGRSFKYGDYWLDYGPHAFHIKNEELTRIIASLSGEEPKRIAMRARLLFGGKYLDYPVSIGGILKNLNPLFSLKACFDFIIASLVRLGRSKEICSFKEWGIGRYGRTIYKMAFGDYTEKVWGMPAEKISYRLAEQKLPNLNLASFLKDVFKGSSSRQRMHYGNYFYPEGGIGTIFEAMASDIVRNGGHINVSCVPEAIDIKSGVVRRVFVSSPAGKSEVACEAVISTIPLADVIPTMSVAPQEVVLSSMKLRYRHLILVYLVINEDNVSDAMMVYLLDPKFKFNRFSEQKNISRRMIPSGKTVICFEICCDKDDVLWTAADDDIYGFLLEDIKKIPYVCVKDIESFFVKRLDEIYTVFDLDFEVNLQRCVDYMSGLENFYPTGRHGLFLNNDMHDTMYMGIETAKYILNGNKSSRGWFKKIKKTLSDKLGPFHV